MDEEEVSILLGGPQGAGLETSAQILTSAVARLGYGVIADREYHSNIKGKHSYIHVRISSKELPQSLTYPVQLVGAMDAETVFTHFHDLEKGGYLVYDSSTDDKTLDAIPSMNRHLKERLEREFKELGLDGSVSSLIKHLRGALKINVVGLNYPRLLADFSRKFEISLPQASRYVSSVLVGAVAGILGLNIESIEYGLLRRFRDRRKLVEQNKYLIGQIAKSVAETHGSPLALPRPRIKHEEYLVVNGNEAVAMAKVVGGLRYESYYPITPAADESFFLEGFERLEVEGEKLGGVLVLQTEDEIAAVTSALGAALAGTRSSTATSGPGFSLMVEGLGWAGINEVPIVITYYQRGGPSTGLPTRGSQSDLLFTLFASHGEFPRVVLASGDHSEAFYDAIEAMNIAEKYQVPVIHLLDKFLANSIVTMPLPDLSRVKIERGELVEGGVDYKRFDITSPVSPRAPLGSNTIMWYTGDEHDEYGHITEDPEVRVRMYDKRMEKERLIDREIPPERRAIYYGPEDAEFLLVGWGFSKGVCLDAIRELEKRGIRGAYLHLRMFNPFPSEYVVRVLDRFSPDKIIVVEHSYSVQAGQVLTLNTGVKIAKSIVKYTGRPIYLHELVQGIVESLDGRERVVLKYGA